jgi:hypothetical protein
MSTATVQARMNNPLMMFPPAFKAMQAMHKATRVNVAVRQVAGSYKG